MLKVMEIWMQKNHSKLKIVFMGLGILLLFSAFSSFLFFQSNSNRGAWIYSDFDEVLDIGNFTSYNPLWPNSLQSEISAAESWRCSTCHGWNYQGVMTYGGEVINFPGLENILNMDDGEISNWINGSTNISHDFSQHLTIQSNDQLLAFFRDSRFQKWVSANEIEIIDTGNSSFGEDIYKNVCIECHGADGAKINIGSISKPIFLGDLMKLDQSRIIHHLEFGKTSHDNLSNLVGELGDADLIDLAKYLRAMPISTTIFEEQEILQLRAFDDQGDLDPLLIAGIILFFLLVTAYVLVSLREQKEVVEE